MIPQLRNGCCGCSLQTSSLVIAWIQVMISGTCLAIAAIGGTAIIAIVMESSSENHPPKDEAALLSIVLAIYIAIMIISLLISIGLLFGIYKRNYCLMMPYLILSGATNVLNILGAVLVFFTIFVNPINFLRFIIHGIVTALSCYFWLILYSFHMEIKIEKNVNENNYNKA